MSIYPTSKSPTSLLTNIESSYHFQPIAFFTHLLHKIINANEYSLLDSPSETKEQYQEKCILTSLLHLINK